jgi:hypothetical protein
MKRILFLAFMILLISAGLTMAAPVYWSGNGHYYEIIDASASWSQARAAANAKSFDTGTEILNGHLVTITSADENLFLTNTLGGGEIENLLHYHWMGGYQPAGSAEPAGGWSWITGEPFNYTNWGGEYLTDPDTGNLYFVQWEPNNSFGTEDCMVFDGGFLTDGKNWNDLTGTWNAAGYIVEYDEYSDIAPVPEPNFLILFGLGLIGIVAAKKSFF